jgi:hypothetical protein
VVFDQAMKIFQEGINLLKIKEIIFRNTKELSTFALERRHEFLTLVDSNEWEVLPIPDPNHKKESFSPQDDNA